MCASQIGGDDLMSDDEHMHRQSLFCHTVASLGPSLFECPTRADMTASFGTASCFATLMEGSSAEKCESPLRAGFFVCYRFATARGGSLAGQPPRVSFHPRNYGAYPSPLRGVLASLFRRLLCGRYGRITLFQSMSWPAACSSWPNVRFQPSPESIATHTTPR